MFASLNINERKPIARMLEKGKKTLYVSVIQNWPQSPAPNYPNVCLDIQIIIKIGFNGIYEEDTIALPRIGLKREFSGDDLIVDAYYSPAQGLVAPYNIYNIEGTIVKGSMPVGISSYVRAYDRNSVPLTVSGGDAFPIPAYSTEFRVNSMSTGLIYFRNELVASTGSWYVVHPIEKMNRWLPLNPMAVYYDLYLTSISGNLNLDGQARENVTVQFR